MACDDDVVVQGITGSDRELLDAQALVGELVPPGSVFAFLAEHRHELFPDSFIADLFCSSGVAVAAGGSGRVGAGAQGAVRPVRPAHRRCGALRHPLEGAPARRKSLNSAAVIRTWSLGASPTTALT